MNKIIVFVIIALSMSLTGCFQTANPFNENIAETKGQTVVEKTTIDSQAVASPKQEPLFVPEEKSDSINQVKSPIFATKSTTASTTSVTIKIDGIIPDNTAGTKKTETSTQNTTNNTPRLPTTTGSTTSVGFKIILPSK